jgi:hypothetical protein
MPIFFCGVAVDCIRREDFVVALLVDIGGLMVLNYDTIEPFYPSDTHDTGKNNSHWVPMIAGQRGVIDLERAVSLHCIKNS